MSAVGDFLTAHLHYTVNQRLFEDTCRQLRDYKGDDDGRKKLIEETMRLAVLVSDTIDAVETALPGAMAYIKKHGTPDPNLQDAILLISNNVKEDRARASAYAMFVTAKKYGGPARAARKPMVANPFILGSESQGTTEEDDDSKDSWDEEEVDATDSEDESKDESEEPDDESSDDSHEDAGDDSDDDSEDDPGDDESGFDSDDDSDDDDSDGYSDDGIPDDDEPLNPDDYDGYDDLGYSEDGEPQE